MGLSSHCNNDNPQQIIRALILFVIMSCSFVLPVKLGQPVCRLLPNDILPYIDDASEWKAFCDAFDRLSLNPIDKNGTILMRLSLMVAIACLVIVILFGYLDSGDDSNSSSSNDDVGDGNEDEDGSSVSTLLVLVTAIPISLPFVMAAFLNCHNASTVSKLLDLCRTSCDRWASAKAVKATVEQLQSVSNTDEVIDKFLIQFDPLPPSNHVLVDTGAPKEASPETAKD